MFDMGFFELLLIGIVALLVLGPERLPYAARMTGAWIGKIRRTMTDVKIELDREIELQELQQRMDQIKRNSTTTIDQEITQHLTDEKQPPS